MTAITLAIVANYAALCLAGLLLARAHVSAARRSGVVALVFVALVLGIEAAEHATTVAAWMSTPPPAPEAVALVALRVSLSWLRLGLTWGLLLGVRFGTLALGEARGMRGAGRLVWQGYRGYCSDVWCRLRSAVKAWRRRGR